MPRLKQLTASETCRTSYDPACGTGGMLALTEEAMTALNPKIRVELFGQELNGESFGICKSDMLVTGHNPEQIAFGNTLISDSNPFITFVGHFFNAP
jgi:type I restriction enzyme M protein